MSSKLNIEELAITKEVAHPIDDLTPYGCFHQLEQALLCENVHIDRITCYLKEIRKALQEKDGQQALLLIDDLEEIMDLDLKNMRGT